jgi:hypothetical protein
LNQISLLKKTVELTQLALDWAESGDWEKFTEAEPNRLHFLQQIDMSSVQEGDADNARQLIEQLILLNDRLKQVCEQTKQEAVQGLKSLKAGASAVKAYK